MQFVIERESLIAAIKACAKLTPGGEDSPGGSVVIEATRSAGLGPGIIRVSTRAATGIYRSETLAPIEVVAAGHAALDVSAATTLGATTGTHLVVAREGGRLAFSDRDRRSIGNAIRISVNKDVEPESRLDVTPHRIAMRGVGRTLRELARCCDADRPGFETVMFTAHNGVGALVATDGYRLTIVAHGASPDQQVNIPADLINAAAFVDADEVFVGVDEASVALRSGAVTVVGPRCSSEPVNWRAILDAIKPHTMELVVDSDDLRAALRRAEMATGRDRRATMSVDGLHLVVWAGGDTVAQDRVPIQTVTWPGDVKALATITMNVHYMNESLRLLDVSGNLLIRYSPPLVIVAPADPANTRAAYLAQITEHLPRPGLPDYRMPTSDAASP